MKTAKILTADTTLNNVDNALEVTFTDDDDWRVKITGIKVDTVSLTSGQYSVTAGKISINEGVIKTAGDHTITVEAEGYSDSIVSQNVVAGAFTATKSAYSLVSGGAAPGGTPTYKLIARDRYNNKIANYQFKVKLDVKNEGQTPTPINEIVTVNGHSYTMPTTNGTNKLIDVNNADVGVTNSEGEVIVAIHYFGNGINGTDWNNGDGVGPVWYDAEGNQIFNN